MTIAQHRNIVSDLRQLIEPVGNVNQRYAALFKELNLFKQQRNFTAGEHGGGFIENQNPAFANQVAGNFDHLLMADTEIPHQHIRIQHL